MSAVVAVLVVVVLTCRWRSTINLPQLSPFRLSPFRRFVGDQLNTIAVTWFLHVLFAGFSPIIKLLGRTEMRTRETSEWPSMRTVWDIFRDDRASIATCSWRTATDTDRFRKNDIIYKLRYSSKVVRAEGSGFESHWCCFGTLAIVCLPSAVFLYLVSIKKMSGEVKHLLKTLCIMVGMFAYCNVFSVHLNSAIIWGL